ncbi:uncharacterized protein LOC142231842 [Haematobia irritans]|uniref:uncharacterized protein LOC142231842 n=1 Tax=Haematobia irritans TaxID=7368 RepID=UPI003F5016AE
MSDQHLCRLCGDANSDLIQLYDEVGLHTQVYEITSYYFQSEFLDLDKGNYIKTICWQCWDRIYKFHSFRNFVIGAQIGIIEKLKQINKTITVSNEYIDISEDKNTAPVKQEIEVFDISDDESYDISEGYDMNDTEYLSENSNVSIDLLYPENDTRSEATESKNSSKITSTHKKVDTRSRSTKTRDEKKANKLKLSSLPEQIRRSKRRKRQSKKMMELINQNGKMSVKTSTRTNQSNSVVIDVDKKRTVDESDQLISQYLPVLECVECHGQFKTFSLLKEHFRTEHIRKEFYITCCHRKFFYRCLIEEHIILHLDPNAYKCKICGRSFSSRANLCSHKHESCSAADSLKHKVRKSVQEIDAIIAIWKPSLQCRVCKKSFVTFSLLQQHFLDDHPNTEFYVKCCERKYSHRFRLEEHVQRHLNPKTSVCEACGKEFHTKISLNVHKCPQKQMSQ